MSAGLVGAFVGVLVFNQRYVAASMIVVLTLVFWKHIK
jgi:hypothetical protein